MFLFSNNRCCRATAIVPTEQHMWLPVTDSFLLDHDVTKPPKSSQKHGSRRMSSEVELFANLKNTKCLGKDVISCKIQIFFRGGLGGIEKQSQPTKFLSKRFHVASRAPFCSLSVRNTNLTPLEKNYECTLLKGWCILDGLLRNTNFEKR